MLPPWALAVHAAGNSFNEVDLSHLAFLIYKSALLIWPLAKDERYFFEWKDERYSHVGFSASEKSCRVENLRWIWGRIGKASLHSSLLDKKKSWTFCSWPNYSSYFMSYFVLLKIKYRLTCHPVWKYFRVSTVIFKFRTSPIGSSILI
jgi:hypothetical protein